MGRVCSAESFRQDVHVFCSGADRIFPELIADGIGRNTKTVEERQMLDGLLRVGVITSPHGIKGEVKVFPTTDDPQKFKRLKSVILYNGKEEKTVDITGVKFFKQFVIVKLKQCNSMNEAELLRKQEFYITKEQSGTCGEDENFVVDLIGLQVLTDQGEMLGRLTDVMETGANDVYVVEMENGKEVLLPAIKQCILRVDLEKQEMLVHIMDGLLD